MTDADILALLFVACSAITWLNVAAILRDKTVRGVSTIPACVFVTTNVFEVYYFGTRYEVFATVGAVAMLLANAGWLVLVWWYRWRDHLDHHFDALNGISLDFRR